MGSCQFNSIQFIHTIGVQNSYISMHMNIRKKQPRNQYDIIKYVQLLLSSQLASQPACMHNQARVPIDNFFKLKCLFLLMYRSIDTHFSLVLQFRLTLAPCGHTHTHIYTLYAVHNCKMAIISVCNVWLRSNRCRSQLDKSARDETEGNEKSQAAAAYFDMLELTSEVIS